MNNINPNNEITKKTSLSLRASKIPQKFVQNSFFSLKPSISTMLDGNGEHNNVSSNRLSARIGNILFRPRASESVMRESSQSLDYSNSSSLSIQNTHIVEKKEPTKKSHHLSISSQFMTAKNNDNSTPQSTTAAKIENNDMKTSHTNQASPYSISSPDRTDFYSYYYNNNDNEAPAINNSMFSPLSFSNSSVSSFNSGLDSQHNQPVSPSISPILFSVTSTATPVDAFITVLKNRCADLLNITEKNSELIIRTNELESIMEQTQHFLNACQEQHCAREFVDLTRQYTNLKADFESSILNPNKSTTSNEEDELIEYTITSLQKLFETCILLLANSPSLTHSRLDGFKKESNHIICLENMTIKEYYKQSKADQIDENANWFRRYFVGKQYTTFIGSLKQSTVSNGSSSLPLISTTPSKSTSTNMLDKQLTSRRKKTTSTKRQSKSLFTAILNSSSTTIEAPTEVDDQVGIISVIQERAKDLGSENGAILGSQYRIIVRSKENKKPELNRFIIHEYMATETQNRLELRGEGSKLDKSNNDSSSKRLYLPFSHQQQHQQHNKQHRRRQNDSSFSSKMMRAAILTALPNIDLRSFKELSSESTVLAGLEKDLLVYDEILIPRNYKFGILNVKENQTEEEAWFSNNDITNDLQDFLDIIGNKVELKGYKGYAAGLDTKTGESGEFTYVSKWDEVDITFHVAPLIPLKVNDRQQVTRKRHIGNDIVCIIFLEGKESSFTPKAIRSQFLHVYILVRPEIVNGSRYWRVEAIHNSNVLDFGPALPSPPLFSDDETLKDFLTLKLINAENAALKSEKLSIPNNKAKASLLVNYVKSGLAFVPPQDIRANSTSRLLTSSSNSKSMPSLVDKQPKLQRSINKPPPVPLPSLQRLNSIGSQQTAASNVSRLYNKAVLDNERRKMVNMSSKDIPLAPTASRSTLLFQDIKQGFNNARKKNFNLTSSSSTALKKSSTHSSLLSRKSSQLKFSMIVEPSLQTVREHDGMSKEKTIRSEARIKHTKNIDAQLHPGVLDVSESFISTDQLFSSFQTLPAVSPAPKTLQSTKRNKPSGGNGTYTPPKLIIGSTRPTTATNMSTGTGMAWK